MSCRQNQQQCQLPANCLPKCPPKNPPQAPQAPAFCPAPCPPPCPPPTSCCCAPSCCLSGSRFPSPYPRWPQPSHCCESGPSGCFLCFHGSGGCN